MGVSEDDDYSGDKHTLLQQPGDPGMEVNCQRHRWSPESLQDKGRSGCVWIARCVRKTCEDLLHDQRITSQRRDR